jgi:hypothetical protein
MSDARREYGCNMSKRGKDVRVVISLGFGPSERGEAEDESLQVASIKPAVGSAEIRELLGGAGRITLPKT